MLEFIKKNMGEDALKSIEDKINIELMKRSFPVRVTASLKLDEKRADYSRVELKSPSFQTVPALFKEIRVENFNSAFSTYKANEGKDNERLILSVWIQVHASYEHFGGGSNGVNIFNFKCSIHEDGDIYKVEIV